MKQETQIIYTDRYSALGIEPPKLDEMCKGQCEGIGYIPVRESTENKVFRELWLRAEKKKKSDDGYHFIKCPECKGTGKINPKHKTK